MYNQGLGKAHFRFLILHQWLLQAALLNNSYRYGGCGIPLLLAFEKAIEYLWLNPVGTVTVVVIGVGLSYL